MKTFSHLLACGLLVWTLAQRALSQDYSRLTGTWQLPEAGLTLQFDAEGTYLVTYANGQRIQARYSLVGNQLTMEQFYFGQDQHFQIVQLDAQTLVLQALDGQPGMQFRFQRMGGQPAVGGFAGYGTSTPPPASSASSAGGQVLSEVQGIQFTQAHFEKLVHFAEFLIAGKLSEAERQQALNESLTEFQQAPQAFIQTVEQIDGQMSQFYQIPDVAQLGLLRSMLVGQFNLAYQQIPPDQKPYLARLIEQYTPVVAYDPSTQMALTWRDVEGYAGVYAFYLEMAGQPVQLSRQELEALASTLAQQFQSATPEQQALLCSMSLYDEYLRNAWAMLNPQQQEQLRQQVIAQLTSSMQSGMYGGGGQMPYGSPYQPSGEAPAPGEDIDAWFARKQQELQTNQFMFNTMNNILLEQHAASLNIIENIGGSDDYWEVKYNDW